MSTHRHLLWTGGWDSTYQLLRSLIVDGDSVEPHYIDFEDHRQSASFERAAMDKIRAEIADRWPEAAARLAPPKVTRRGEIAPDPQITEAHARLKAQSYIGDQYDWLARYCRQYRVPKLNLCIHRDDKAFKAIRDRIEPVPDRPGTYRLQGGADGSDAALIFGSYVFPVLDMSKIEMGQAAAEHGLAEVMALTWFCHTPIGGAPCGRCNPCRYTIEEGFGHRIRPMRRWTGWVYAHVIYPTCAWIKPRSRALRVWLGIRKPDS